MSDFASIAYFMVVVNALATTALGIFTFLRAPGIEIKRENDAARKRLQDELHEQHLRLSAIETALKHTANSEELAELEGTLKALSKELDGMREAMRNTHQAVVRVEDYLRNHR